MLLLTAVVSKTTNRQSLIQGHDYEVIGIDQDSFMIIDLSGEPVSYPRVFFLVCEVELPSDWVLTDYGEGEFTCDPPEFAERGFYEDYGNGLESALLKFRKYRERSR